MRSSLFVSVQLMIDRSMKSAVKSTRTPPREGFTVLSPPTRHLTARLRAFVDWLAETAL